MKKFVTLTVVVFFMILVWAGTSAKAEQPSGVRGTTKTQQKSSVSPSSTKATSEELAAINRLCQGLHRIKSKLQQIKGPLSEAKKMNNEMKQVSIRIKKESLTPHSEKRGVEKKPSEGESDKPSGLIPEEKTKGQIGVSQQMQKINGNMKKIKERVILIKTNIEHEWKKMEGDLRTVRGSSRITSQDRQCISKEVKGIENEVSSLQSQIDNLKSQTDNLKSQMDDLRSQFEQQYGQSSCVDLIGQDCNIAQCYDCCSWKFKITDPQDIVHQGQRERCRSLCDLQATDCMQHSLFDILSTILKDNREKTSSNLGQMGRF